MADPHVDGGREAGQAAVTTMMAAIAVFVVVLTALALMGGATIDRTRAQSLADAAALGAAGRGRHVAIELVHAGGGEVVSWRSGPGPSEVTVVVRVGRATARAAATAEP